MLVDSHCHLDFKDFDADRESVITRAKNYGVEYIINVGASAAGIEESIKLAMENDFIYAAAGLHPHEADNINETLLASFNAYLDNKKVVAVGEIGLDYYKNISSKENQKTLFIRLLEEARKSSLPVIIHNRDAHKDILSILKEAMGSEIKGVMHCFSGDKVFLNDCLDLGLSISVTCNITFKNAAGLREIVKLVPIDRLLLETDAPFLAPQIYRGKRNEPSYVKILAEEAARIKNISFEELANRTTSNAKKLFNLK